MLPLDQIIANAILGIDTLWGGDVMHPSGTGRFIADSWFSDQPLPAAYTHPSAQALRAGGGVSASTIDHAAVEAYLKSIDIAGAIQELKETAAGRKDSRGQYLLGLGLCLEAMWDLAMEQLGKGDPVPYQRCVELVIGEPPHPSHPEEKRQHVAELLTESGYSTGTEQQLLEAVEAWRQQQLVPFKSIPALGGAFVALYDQLSRQNLLPFLPAELHKVPRANIRFLPIADAWFSGSMNYLGRARKSDGSPRYEATYELNASLRISVPEFQQLVSHEVVPGHVTTFAYLQNFFFRGLAGFEASVLTMNTRASALFEGIANNAILIAYGVTSIDQLPDPDLQMGVLLALLQDDAKNQASYLTWEKGWSKAEVASALRKDFLISHERADKLSGAWGRHPLQGRMYLPAYKAGTDLVARLRQKYPPHELLPALYGCRGLVDMITIQTLFPV
jgi:hypothetical protein